MSQPAATVMTREEALLKVNEWETRSPTYEEKREVIDALRAAFATENLKKKFEDKIKAVATTAVKIGQEFSKIEEDFKNLGTTESKIASKQRGTWVGLKNDWSKNLLDSRDVASELSTKLTSWDTLCRRVIKEAKTSNQKKQALELLQNFKEANSERSRTMHEAFNNLQKGLDPFSDDFSRYLVSTGATKGREVDRYTQEVKDCTTAVSDAKEALEWAQKALVGTAAGAWIWLLPLLGSTAAVLILQNNYKAAKTRLEEAQTKLNTAKGDSDAVASLKIRADQLILKIIKTSSDIGLFSGIWAHIRNQAVKIETHIKAGSDSVGTLMFALELEHAEIITLPLAASLRQYATQILD